MPTLRTYCPSCQIVAVEPAAMLIEVSDRDDLADMSFTCPQCGQLVRQWVNRWAVPVLRDAGCTVLPAPPALADHPARPSFGAQTRPLSEAEIDGFVAALDDPAWDELLAP